MIYLIITTICFIASAVGNICGIGGGVIIKPALDLFCNYSVTSISFMSGITVLSMTTYSVFKGKMFSRTRNQNNSVWQLAVGSALGGVIGKVLFESIKNASDNPGKVGFIQSLCLAIITIGTLVYMLRKDKIKTINVSSVVFCCIIGLCLGVMSSFIGIGGGPINIVVLFYFFNDNKSGQRVFAVSNFLFSTCQPCISTVNQVCS